MSKAKSPEKVMDEAIEKVEKEKLDLEDWPLETIRDYRLYNEEARKMNKKLKVCRYPIKQCPEELHPKQRVTVHIIDQPTNPIPVHISNENIHFDKKLMPGIEYDLPECVIHHLSTLGYPEWKQKIMPDGSMDTFFSNKKPRIAIRTVYAGM